MTPLSLAAGFCWILLFGSTVCGQSLVDPEDEPQVTASLVPVGANSDAYWVGKGPEMRAVALDPGAAPPETLAVRVRNELIRIPTILNRPSPSLDVSGGRLRVFASMQASENDDPPVYADFTLPATPGHYDIFLTRSSERPDWKEPTSLVLASNAETFPKGAVRLVNLDGQPVRVELGKIVVNLAPNRAQIVRSTALPSAEFISIRAANLKDSGPIWIMRSGIRNRREDRVNVIFYPDRKPNQPSKVTWYTQFTSSPLVPEAESEQP